MIDKLRSFIGDYWEYHVLTIAFVSVILFILATPSGFWAYGLAIEGTFLMFLFRYVSNIQGDKEREKLDEIIKILKRMEEKLK